LTLPDLSYSTTVGRWRYIQYIHETSEHRKNPDYLVGHFLPLVERWKAKWISRKKLGCLRSNRLYYYLVARTRYYDQVFLDAIERDAQYIINIGCGTDTRSYRFANELQRKGTSVCECDQPLAIRAKQKICQHYWPSNNVSYVPLDLNDGAWPGLEHWLGRNVTGSALVMMEGVTPYVNDHSFSRFLEMLADRLPSGSHVAYDFKILGLNDVFGLGGQTQSPFRLSSNRESVAAYHKSRKYRLVHMEMSNELSIRLIPDLANSGLPLFCEDALIQVEL
jgi:methyltransferase (TIGR00027 family)